MSQWSRWILVGALIVGVMGCGKKEAQVVTPRPSETEVVIWIDQVGITHGQLQREASRLFANLSPNLPQDQVVATQGRILEQAVDNLVVRELVRAEMERSGILISREEIEQGKRELEQNLGPDQSLAMLLAASNLSVTELENNLVLDLFKNKALKDKIEAEMAQVTEETIRTYYEEHPNEFTVPEGKLASHILIRVADDADETARRDARARAEGVRQALLEGADFEALARETSQCMSRRNGGRLGVIPRGREDPAFEEAVYSQATGEIGEVVESPVGFHVILVTGDQEEKLLDFEEVQERLGNQLRAQLRQRLTVEYIDGLKNKATIRLDGSLAQLSAQTGRADRPAEVAEDEPAPSAP